jgi:hypothetical protein
MMRELHERAVKSPLKAFVPFPSGHVRCPFEVGSTDELVLSQHTDTWLAKSYSEATEKFLRQVFQLGEATVAKASGAALL